MTAPPAGDQEEAANGSRELCRPRPSVSPRVTNLDEVIRHSPNRKGSGWGEDGSLFQVPAIITVTAPAARSRSGWISVQAKEMVAMPLTA